jgi:hypothetical protein
MTRAEKQKAAAVWRTQFKDELCRELQEFIKEHPGSLCGELWKHGDAWLTRKAREMPQRRSEIIRAGEEVAREIKEQLATKAVERKKES